MALTTTTLNGAVVIDQNTITVTSATGFAAKMYVLVDQELMQVTTAYPLTNQAVTVIPVQRGVDGTQTLAHVTGANVTVFLAADGPSAAQTPTEYPYRRATIISSITATGTLTLPVPGCDARVLLNGTSVINLTVPVPTKDMDGCRLLIVSNGVAAHVITFTGGLGGVGAGYTALTTGAGARFGAEVVAVNGAWTQISAPGWSGTLTKVTAGLA